MSERPDSPSQGADPTEERWPVGFLLFVGLAALYLAVRLVQMAGWALDRLF